MDDAAEIAAREQALVDALKAMDRPVLEDILAPEFRLVGIRSTGSSDMPRAAWLEAAPEMNFLAFWIDPPRVELFGDTALAGVDGYWRIDLRGRRIDERFLLTDVWLRRDGGWRLLRRHSSPYQPASGA